MNATLPNLSGVVATCESSGRGAGRPELSRGRLIIRVLITVLCFTFCSSLGAAQNIPRVVHVFVALADNAHQGIVPVPARLGNGDDPEHNLYWGAAYGVKTFFVHSADWHLTVSQAHPKPAVLERCTFHHRTDNVFLLAGRLPGKRDSASDCRFSEGSGWPGRSKCIWRCWWIGWSSNCSSPCRSRRLRRTRGPDGFQFAGNPTSKK
jgi:hypothetical protein